MSCCSRRGHQAWAAVLTFWGYAAIHTTRKALSEIKPVLEEQWTTGAHAIYKGPDAIKDAKAFFGTLDAVFMFAYAIGLIVAGDIGDRVNLRLLLSGCMAGSAVVTGMFGLGAELGVGPWYFGLMWTLNGLVQSACWPAVVAVMGNWWGKGVRGAAMGLWSGNASAGNAISGVVCGALLHAALPWSMCMYTTGAILLLSAVLTFFTLVQHPHEVGLKSIQELEREGARGGGEGKGGGLLGIKGEDAGMEGEEALGGEMEADVTHQLSGTGGSFRAALLGDASAIAPRGPRDKAATGESSSSAAVATRAAAGIWVALSLPGTVVYSLCYACLKAVNYTMFFVLPLYLSNSSDIPASRADYYSTLYDLGGIVGGLAAGAVTDCLPRRSPVVIALLLLAVPALILFGTADKTDLALILLCSGTGFLVGGAANLVSSVFAVEIAEQVHGLEAGKAKQALATVTGIIDGTASIGAGIVLQLAGFIPEGSLFAMLAPLSALSALCLSQAFLKDMAEMGCTCRAASRHEEAAPALE